MGDTHFQAHQRETERLRSELHEIEQNAGVRERHANFVEYHGDSHLRSLYFSVLDKPLRKELIAQCRSLMCHTAGYTRSQIMDSEEELTSLELKGFATPWLIPAAMAGTAVWLGWEFASMPGALSGALVGFFVGNAYISGRRNAYNREVALVKAQIAEFREEEKRDQVQFGRSHVFSETEEDSGAEDEGIQPEPDIHWYSRLGDVEAVKREIMSSVSVELENSESWGSHPLHRAAASCNTEVVRALVEAGANVRAANRLHGWLPIHYAAKHGCAETLRVLIAAASPVQVIDKYGNQPIHLAAQSGDPDSVKILLDAGAKADIQGGPYLSQPIHEAARAGHAEVVQALLAAGADVNAPNDHGVTPLDLASSEKESNFKRTIRVLESAGGRRKASEAA